MADIQVVAKQSPAKPYGRNSLEADRLAHAGIVRATSGAAEIYTDNNTTSIVVGGGSGLTGVAVDLQAGIGDLRMSARSMVTPLTLNQTGHVDLNAAFSSASVTSLVKALNTLQDGTVPIVIPGGGTLTAESFTLDADGDSVLTMSNNVSATGIKILFILGVAYFEDEGFFTVSGANNEIWTWENDYVGWSLKKTDRIVALYFAE